MSGSIMITADDIYQLRAKLGLHMHPVQRIGVAPSGDHLAPKFKVFLDDEVRVVKTAEEAGRLITLHLKKRFKPEKRGGKKRSLRTKPKRTK